MVAESKTYKGEPIRTTVLRLIVVVEIIICVIVMAVLVAAGDGVFRMPTAELAIYQGIVKAMSYLPAAAILSLMFWIFRANKNARALSPEALENSPGWAAGWFLVPIASLWKPYEVMREIYKASRTPHDWRKAKGTAIVGWWWGTYLLANFVAVAMLIAHSMNDAISLRRLALVLYSGMIVHQLMLLVITGRIVKWQAAAHRQGGVETIF
jgi:hypothetical protein